MPSAAEFDFAPVFLAMSGVGVDLFFVISGFIMVYASGPLYRKPGASMLFLTRRAARIVPLYWLMTTIFVLTLIVMPGTLSTSLPSLGEIVQSYLFIPYEQAATGLMQPVYKLGWTLNYEMFFYLAFAVCLIRGPQDTVMMLAAFFSTYTLIGAIWLDAPAVMRFLSDPIMLEFVFGAVIGLAYLEGRRIEAVPAMVVLALGLLALQAGSWLEIEPTGSFRTLFWGIPAALIVAGMALTDTENNQPDHTGKVDFIQRLGDASYSLYLLHPLVIRLLRLVWDKTGLSSAINPWFFVLVGLGLLVPLAMLMYRHFEMPVTAYVQKRLLPAKTTSPVVAPA